MFCSKIKNVINHIFKIFLALIPNKKLRAKLKADWTKFYLKKYVNLAVKNTVFNDNAITEKLPPIIQFWEQGFENAPEIVKTCVNSIEKYAPEFEHLVLDINTIKKYVEIPDYIWKLKNNGKIGHAHFSDILRSSLLAQRPCFWIDSTILLTGPVPDYIKNSDFFMYKGTKKTPENFKAANFFIYSKQPNLFLKQLQNALFEYWQKNDFLVSYFAHSHIISLLAEKNPDFWEKIPVYDEDLTLQFAKILFSEFDEEKYEKITSEFPFHKLSYKIPKKLKTDIDKTYYKNILERANA